MDLYRNKYRINSTRLANWDYGSNGFYFVTICTKAMERYFGDIPDNVETQYFASAIDKTPATDKTQNIASVTDTPVTDKTQNIASLHATEIGEIAIRYWSEIPLHFSFVELDEFVVMPDHVHGILLFNKPDYIDWKPNKAGPQSQNLASVMRGYKAGVKAYATTNGLEFQWQSRFYDRVIKSADELERIRKYIIDNPAKWSAEKNNPESLYR